jgi:hypothetical protein
MLQIVEMWGAFMGNECENLSLKNLWLDVGLEGGKQIPQASLLKTHVQLNFSQTTYSWRQLSKTL